MTDTGPWIYRWPDGAAVLAVRSIADPQHASGQYLLGELWLSADLHAARYVWSAWDGGRADACWRSWLRDALEHDPGYVLGKLLYGAADEYDHVATDEAVRAHIIECRRARWMTRREARVEWDLWEAVDPQNLYGAHLWVNETQIEDPGSFMMYTRRGADDFARHLRHLLAALEVDSTIAPEETRS